MRIDNLSNNVKSSETIQISQQNRRNNQVERNIEKEKTDFYDRNATVNKEAASSSKNFVKKFDIAKLENISEENLLTANLPSENNIRSTSSLATIYNSKGIVDNKSVDSAGKTFELLIARDL